MGPFDSEGLERENDLGADPDQREGDYGEAKPDNQCETGLSRRHQTPRLWSARIELFT